jgi:hypothetical protein
LFNKVYHLDTCQLVHIGRRSGSESLYQRSMLFSQTSQNVNCVSATSEMADLLGTCDLHTAIITFEFI